MSESERYREPAFLDAARRRRVSRDTLYAISDKRYKICDKRFFFFFLKKDQWGGGSEIFAFADFVCKSSISGKRLEIRARETDFSSGRIGIL